MRDRYYSEGIVLIVLVHVCRWVVGGIFIAAALPKIFDVETFMRVVANYNLLPLFLVPVAAVIIPWLELCCGACLLLNRCVQSASAILSALIIVFIVGLAVNYARGANFDCGCFGVLFGSGDISVMTIARDAFLLGLTAFILLLSGRRSAAFKSKT